MSESESEPIGSVNQSEPFWVDSNLLATAAARTVAIAAYSTVFLLGLLGNSSVIYVIYRHRKLRTTVNVLVANLALADICTCAIPNVFTPFNVFVPRWPLGHVLCKLLPMVSSSSIFVSSLTSTVIAVDRYLAVHSPHRTNFGSAQLAVSLLTIWLLAVLFSSPISMFTDIVMQQCVENWPDSLLLTRKYYTWTCFSFQFVVPSLIVLYSYACIIRTLNCRLRHNLKKGWSVLVKRRIKKIQTTCRINKMLMLMVASFMICYLPMNVFNILMEAQPSLFGHHTIVVYLVVHWIAMSSTIYNPLLCITFNTSFRDLFCYKCRSTSQPEDLDNTELANSTNNLTSGKTSNYS